MYYDGKFKYEVVFVDEYSNWFLVGFFDSLAEAKPLVNEYLSLYEDEEGRTVELGVNDTPDLTEVPNTFGPTFDMCIDVPEGYVQVRGFVFR